MQQPAEIDGELLRLRTGKQHAEIERVEKASFADPFELFDEQAMHDGNLPGRPAEAQQTDLQPYHQSMIETDVLATIRRLVLTGTFPHHHPVRPASGGSMNQA